MQTYLRWRCFISIEKQVKNQAVKLRSCNLWGFIEVGGRHPPTLRLANYNRPTITTALRSNRGRDEQLGRGTCKCDSRVKGCRSSDSREVHQRQGRDSRCRAFPERGLDSFRASRRHSGLFSAELGVVGVVLGVVLWIHCNDCLSSNQPARVYLQRFFYYNTWYFISSTLDIKW